MHRWTRGGACALLWATLLVLVFGCARRAAVNSERAIVPAQEVVERPASLVLRGGRIVTMDPEVAEADAIAVAGDRIIAVGTERDIAPWIGAATRILDLKGATAVPGFIEGHGHFLRLGDRKLTLDLSEAKGWQEIVTRVAEAVKRATPGELIRGRGWHQEKWQEPPEPNLDGLPTHATLSAASPENPVVLMHASGHAAFVNQLALKLSRIDRSTQDPEGGTIVRDGKGEPTGMLRETAMSLVEVEPPSSPALNRRRVELASQECLSKGVTSFQDAGSSFETIDFFRTLAERGELPIRLWVMVRDEPNLIHRKLERYRILDAGNHHLTVRAVKHSIDGALGSHGAWLLEPYADMPESTGLNTTPVETIERAAELAKRHDFQLCVHAIGDRGNREALDLFARVLGPNAKALDHRWRIEHAQHLHPDDVPRFAEHGVIASMQGVHCTSDAPWVIPRLGRERAERGAYVWRTLLDSGVIVSNGTDAPVEDVDPIANFHASVTRKTKDGSAFFLAQRMTRLEALRSQTIDVAHAAFEEHLKGSLSPGKLADITVLSRDILSVPDNELLSTKVLYTIVGGAILYRAGDDP